MDSLLVWLASFPDITIYGIIGVISSTLVALIFHLNDLQRFSKRWREGLFGHIPLWVPVVGIVYGISVELSEVALPWLHVYHAADLVDKSRLIKVILQYHPEAKSEMQSVLHVAKIINRYVGLHTATASDAAIHNLLKNDSLLIDALQTKPQTCVSYSLQTGIHLSDIPEQIVKANLDLKADVIESSIKTPVHRENLTLEQAGAALVDAYRKNSFDISEIEKIGNIKSLPAEDGCTIARHFSAALANMDEKTAASVYTSLMAMAN